jgi:hypothetical protein
MNKVIITSVVTVPSMTKTAICYRTVEESGKPLSAGTWLLDQVVTINNKEEQDALIALLKPRSDWEITLDEVITWAEVLAETSQA